MPPFWTVVRSRHGQESFASDRLGERGFPCLLPKVMNGRAGPSALFTGYLFTYVSDRWHEIGSTIGVSCIVRFGMEPARVPLAVIEDLRSRMDADGVIALPKRPRFKLGDRVEIVGGAFSGRLAIYAGQGQRAREAVLLSILGAQRRIEIAAEHIAEA
jgi:transcriptional antiterminator RfaH